MHWKLILNQTTGKVELWQDNECLATREWQEQRNTSYKILSALETIRKEKGLDWHQVPELQLELDLPPHATARRIAETFEKTYTAFVASV